MTIQITQQNLSKLMIESVQYCMGRMTFAVSECCEIVRLHWNDLPKEAKDIIQRDLTEGVERYYQWHKNGKGDISPLGYKADAEEWIELLAWIEQQEKENEQRK